MAEFRLYQRTKLFVNLSEVLDCRDVAALGLTHDILLNDVDYSVGQELGLAAVRRRAEGILVPSATRAGDNLILFPDNRLPASRLELTQDMLDLRHLVIP